MNFVISIFSILISFTTFVKLVMAFTIANEPVNNLLFFLFRFLLCYPCTHGEFVCPISRVNRISKQSIPKHRNFFFKTIGHPKCFNIMFITNIHIFSLKIHHIHCYNPSLGLATKARGCKIAS